MRLHCSVVPSFFFSLATCNYHSMPVLAAVQTYQDLEVRQGQLPPLRQPSLLGRPPSRNSMNGGLPNGPGAGQWGGGHGAGAPEADPIVLAAHLVDFWTNICLCHSLIVEEAADDGPPIYQASGCAALSCSSFMPLQCFWASAASACAALFCSSLVLLSVFGPALRVQNCCK
jgi:hypothetical protein